MLGMIVLAAASAASPPPPSSARVPNVENVQPPACAAKGVAPVDDGKAIVARKLNELPNADQYLGVLRIGPDGCPKPAIVRYDIGGNPMKQF